MKFLASAMLALVLLPVESASGQEPGWDKLTKLTPGSKIELVDAQSGTIQGQLVSIDDQSLTIRRKGNESGVTETIARADVVRVIVKRPSLKKIALLAAGGSAFGALAGGYHCTGGSDYFYSPSGGYSVCRGREYFKGGSGVAIGAGAGAALGLLGFAFPDKKILYHRPLLAKAKDSNLPTSVDRGTRNEPPLPSLSGSSREKLPASKDAVPTRTDCETRSFEQGDCHAAQE